MPSSFLATPVGSGEPGATSPTAVVGVGAVDTNALELVVRIIDLGVRVRHKPLFLAERAGAHTAPIRSTIHAPCPPQGACPESGDIGIYLPHSIDNTPVGHWGAAASTAGRPGPLQIQNLRPPLGPTWGVQVQGPITTSDQQRAAPSSTPCSTPPPPLRSPHPRCTTHYGLRAVFCLAVSWHARSTQYYAAHHTRCPLPLPAARTARLFLTYHGIRYQMALYGPRPGIRCPPVCA
jgi:hypothetical protein